MSANRWTGSWQDSEAAARSAVVAEVKLPIENFVPVEYADGCTYVPIAPKEDGSWGDEFDITVSYSSKRDQHRATIVRRQHYGEGN
jgi:hypothetical protein